MLQSLWNEYGNEALIALGGAFATALIMRLKAWQLAISKTTRRLCVSSWPTPPAMPRLWPPCGCSRGLPAMQRSSLPHPWRSP